MFSLGWLSLARMGSVKQRQFFLDAQLAPLELHEQGHIGAGRAISSEIRRSRPACFVCKALMCVVSMR
jgi:hypothetical protein